jgi:tRNA (adenine37-N6)-methyltransferase
MKSSENTPQTGYNTDSGLVLQQVGIIKNKIKKPFLAAGKNGIKMQKKTDDAIAEYHKTRLDISEIIIHKKWIDILDGIEEYSHLVVLYWAHRVPEKSRSLNRIHPMGRKEFPLVGIFCTCSPARPNPVLMTVVRLCGRKKNVLEVTGLDAVDGSPVIDIKPYVKEFYPQKEVIIPEWMRRILREVDQVIRKRQMH